MTRAGKRTPQRRTPPKRTGRWRPPPAPRTGAPKQHSFWVGMGVGLVASAGILTAHFLGGHASSGGPQPTVVRTFDSGRLPGVLTTPPPWSANTAAVPQRVVAMSLPHQFGLTIHTHQHLDIYVNGSHVVVPSGIGIDPGGRFLVPLHTHDDSGVIHVESGVRREYTLGEFFGVWGVRFTRRCLGSYCAPAHPYRVYVGGQRVHTDPTKLPLLQHQEIAIVVGPKPATVPSSYDFPPQD